MNDQRFLIALDLDDTILSDYFSLNSESVKALIRAQAAGHVVMIATARPRAMALPYHRAMGLHGPISTLNGAYLFHPDDPSFPRFEALMSAESMRRFAEAAENADVRKVWMEVNGHAYAVEEPVEDFFYFREVMRQSGTTYAPHLPIMEAARAYACCDTEAQNDAIHRALDSDGDIALRTYRSPCGEYRININSVRADKWFSIQHAAEYYNIPTENIITFGDEQNDRRMIFSAGHGYVMCNGNQNLVADARANGVGVTEYPCAEGGIARTLKTLLG